MTKIVALVPARGGSKGIYLKNLKKVGGLHLVNRAVLAARKSKLVDSVYVSSDSQDILSAASDAGAIPILRPDIYSQDHSSTEDVLLHFCSVLHDQEIYPEILVYLQCTSPFTTPDEVSFVIETLLNNPSIDCTFSAIEDHSFLWKIDKDGVAAGVNHNAYEQRQRRQDLNTSYRETGAVYAVRVQKLLESKNRFGKRSLPVNINKSLPFEIDTPFDLELAQACESLFKLNDISSIIKRIKAVIFDFDGVMTDDKVYVNEHGEEFIRCCRADGLGIELIKSIGIRVLILTREDNKVVLRRAEKIGSEIINGVRNKLQVLKTWSKNNEIKSSEIIYVGNDANDLSCLEWAGLGMVPSDANPTVLATGFLRLKNKGGEGVAREIAELLLKTQRDV